MMGSSEVAAIGIGSVTHQLATQSVQASTASPLADKLGMSHAITMMKARGPRIRPTLCLVLFIVPMECFFACSNSE